jgi:hypothetical protein
MVAVMPVAWPTASGHGGRDVLQGVLVAPVIPEWLQTALLTVLLAYVASKTLAKGQKQFQKERSSAQTAQQQPAVQCVPSSHVVVFWNASRHCIVDCITH